MFAWRCWGVASDPDVLCSFLDPMRFITRWQPGLQQARCAFHDHPAPDDGPVCGRCGWRGQPDLDKLLWWLYEWKHVKPPVIGGVNLSGRIFQGDHAHPEIPGILRAEYAEVAGPLIVEPGIDPGPLAGRYGVDVSIRRTRPHRPAPARG